VESDEAMTRIRDPKQSGARVSWLDSLFEQVPQAFPGDSLWADTVIDPPEMPEVSDSDWQAFQEAQK
jgi:hypothetical protein